MLVPQRDIGREYRAGLHPEILVAQVPEAPHQKRGGAEQNHANGDLCYDHGSAHRGLAAARRILARIGWMQLRVTLPSTFDNRSIASLVDCQGGVPLRLLPPLGQSGLSGSGLVACRGI